MNWVFPLTPLEPLQVGGFIGRDALLAQQESGVAKRLLQFRLQDPEPLLYHDEPIWRDDRLVGHITSGAYGHSLGACIGLGYVPFDQGSDPAEIICGNFEIEVAGVRVPADASLRPLYDPNNERIRC